MFDPGPCVYMEKIAVGPEGVGVIDLTRPASDNIEALAKAKGTSPRDITAVILDRPRHEDLIAEVRSTGARIRLIPDGDVAGAISTAWTESGADILLGIGGTPEGVITAAALKCMGGELQGRLWPRDEQERAAAIAAGYDLDQVLGTDDLVKGDNCFFAATGITDGELLKGVHFSRHDRVDAVAGHAVEVGHGAPHQRPAPALEAGVVLLDRLRLTPFFAVLRARATRTATKTRRKRAARRQCDGHLLYKPALWVQN